MEFLESPIAFVQWYAEELVGILLTGALSLLLKPLCKRLALWVAEPVLAVSVLAVPLLLCATSVGAVMWALKFHFQPLGVIVAGAIGIPLAEDLTCVVLVIPAFLCALALFGLTVFLFFRLWLRGVAVLLRHKPDVAMPQWVHDFIRLEACETVWG